MKEFTVFMFCFLAVIAFLAVFFALLGFCCWIAEIRSKKRAQLTKKVLDAHLSGVPFKELIKMKMPREVRKALIQANNDPLPDPTEPFSDF